MRPKLATPHATSKLSLELEQRIGFATSIKLGNLDFSYVFRTGTRLDQTHSPRARYLYLRATATLAFRSPLRLASLIPQAFSADHFGTRVSSTPAASKR